MESFCNIWVHLVWTTKHREPIMIREKRILICKHILESAEKKSHHIDFINGVEDHLHCLVKLKSSVPISRLVNDIKGESSHWINEINLIEAFDWQDGYGAFSVSPSQLKKVRNYIKNQEKHHLRQSFEDEMKWFKELEIS